jgi:hypothetical protein
MLPLIHETTVFFLWNECLPYPISARRNVVTVDVGKGRTRDNRKCDLSRRINGGLIRSGRVVSTKADSVTDPATKASYTLTSTFMPDSTKTFDVTLTVDASHFLTPDGTTTGFLSALAVQFPGTNDAVLLSAPGGLDLWGNQNLTPNGACDYSTINGWGVGFTCIPNTSPNAAGAVPAKLTFVFGVLVLDSSANIFALYAETSNGAGLITGDNIIGETPVTSVPIQNTNSGGGTGGQVEEEGAAVPRFLSPACLRLSIGLVALAVFHRALTALPKVSTV